MPLPASHRPPHFDYRLRKSGATLCAPERRHPKRRGTSGKPLHYCFGPPGPLENATNRRKMAQVRPAADPHRSRLCKLRQFFASASTEHKSWRRLEASRSLCVRVGPAVSHPRPGPAPSPDGRRLSRPQPCGGSGPSVPDRGPPPRAPTLDTTGGSGLQLQRCAAGAVARPFRQPRYSLEHRWHGIGIPSFSLLYRDVADRAAPERPRTVRPIPGRRNPTPLPPCPWYRRAPAPTGPPTCVGASGRLGLPSPPSSRPAPLAQRGQARRGEGELRRGIVAHLRGSPRGSPRLTGRLPRPFPGEESSDGTPNTCTACQPGGGVKGGRVEIHAFTAHPDALVPPSSATFARDADAPEVELPQRRALHHLAW